MSKQGRIAPIRLNCF